MPINPSMSLLFTCIGNKLSHIRTARREKIASVAKSIGVSPSVVSQVENGRYVGLSFGLLSRFAAYYLVTLDELLLSSLQKDTGHIQDQSLIINLLISELSNLRNTRRMEKDTSGR